jgi:hypothetical protein
MLCLVRLDSVVIVNQFFCFVPRVQKIFALVEYLRVIFLPTLYQRAQEARRAALQREAGQLEERAKPTSVYHLSHRSTDMYSQIYVYIVKCLYIQKKCGVGRALARRATRAAHFNGVVHLLPRHRPIQGALELPKYGKSGGRRAHGHI